MKKGNMKYAVTGFLVWAVIVFVALRYVLSVHGMLATIGLTAAAAILGGISAYRESESRK